MIMRLPSFLKNAVMVLMTMLMSIVGAVPAMAQQTSNSSNILIVGGGTHHDFDRWFNLEDTKILSEVAALVRYTDQPKNIRPVLVDTDILYLSNNQPMPDPDLRNSVFDFVESGKDLLLVHAAIWYNWEDWPEYNNKLVGGGSRSHPPYGEFEVQVVDSNHPLMRSVPESFTIKDELYRFEIDEDGSDIHVLANGIDPETGDEYPVAWTVDYGEGRIVCITLGHDGEAHTHDAFKTMLKNSVNWMHQN
jgi:type 1 glutamine amidotransferase